MLKTDQLVHVASHEKIFTKNRISNVKSLETRVAQFAGLNVFFENTSVTIEGNANFMPSTLLEIR